MKKVLVALIALATVFGIYLGYSMISETAPVANALNKDVKEAYSGTIYIAGMGGHFAQAEVEIDPTGEIPIIIKDLDRVVIGSKMTHPTHDARIDAKKRTKMFWSTYKIDKEAKGRTVHVGVSDLKTGEVIKDVALQLPEQVKWASALYCGSGQTEKSFLPVTMTNEAFIDVFDKESLKLQHRVYLDSLGYKDNYLFFHGINSPDMKTFAVAINKTKPWVKPDEPAARIGQIDMLLLDLPALEKGKVKMVAKNTITGSPKKTMTFRQTFTPDGKYLLQSGADRFYLLNGNDMSLLDEEMMTDGETHDAIPTPDGKYAILTLRSKIATPEAPEGHNITDGMLQLYDIQQKRLVGAPSSVCYACHKDEGLHGNSVLCGADVNWNL